MTNICQCYECLCLGKIWSLWYLMQLHVHAYCCRNNCTWRSFSEEMNLLVFWNYCTEDALLRLCRWLVAYNCRYQARNYQTIVKQFRGRLHFMHSFYISNKDLTLQFVSISSNNCISFKPFSFALLEYLICASLILSNSSLRSGKIFVSCPCLFVFHYIKRTSDFRGYLINWTYYIASYGSWMGRNRFSLLFILSKIKHILLLFDFWYFFCHKALKGKQGNRNQNVYTNIWRQLGSFPPLSPIRRQFKGLHFAKDFFFSEWFWDNDKRLIIWKQYLCVVNIKGNI